MPQPAQSSQPTEPPEPAQAYGSAQPEASAHGELVIVAVEEFKHYPQLAAVHTLVADVEQALARSGFRRRLPALRGAVETKAARDLIQDWRPDGRPLLLYWTGHGLRRENGELFLACTDTPADPGDETVEVLRARQLGALLALKQLPQIVLFLDACNSGGGVGDVIAGFVERRRTLALPDGAKPELAVIASAWPEEKAKEGIFAGALVELLGGETLPPGLPPALLSVFYRESMVSAGHLAGALQAIFDRDEVGWQTIEHDLNGYGVRPVFLNPHYRPNLPAVPVELRAQEPLPQSRIAAHFLLKFRGIEVLGDRGWYFSGRDRTLAEIDQWLAAPGHGVFVLTGPPGCGKSAVLGRLAVLSDEDTRRQAEQAGAVEPDTVVPVGALDAGLHIRDKSFAECVREIAQALGFETADEEQLFREVRARGAVKGRPLVLMLDALDEAKTDNVLDIAGRLIRGLASTGEAKVLVGTRSGTAGEVHRPGRAGLLDTVLDLLSHGSGDRIWRLDLDESPADRDADIRDYVARRLLDTAGSPYAGLEAAALAAGDFVAPRCEGMFLPARVFSRVLALQGEPTALTDESLRGLSARDLGHAFAKDLARFGVEEPWVRTMLRPLAWAEGNGLPPALWHRLAELLRPQSEVRPAGLTGPPTVLAADSVARALDLAAAYLIEDGEGGQLVYRLYAEQFGEFLRQGQDPVRTQARITRSLIGSVERGSFREWDEANPYVLRHLPAHAAAGGELATLFDDPRYLIHADPERLRAVLGGIDPQTAPMARLYDRVKHRMQGLSPEGRAEVLQEAASRDEPELLDRLSELLDTVWHGLGSTAEPTPFHRVLHGHAEPVTMIGFCAKPDRTLLVSSDGATVNVWDTADGERLRLLTRQRVAPRHAAIGTLGDGAPVLAVAEPGGVRFTDLLSGGTVRTLAVPGGQRPVVAYGAVAGRAVLAVGAAAGTELVDPEPEADAAAPLLRISGGPVLDLALASGPDRDVLAVADRAGITLRDARSGAVISELTMALSLWTMALAVDEDGRILLAVGGTRGVVKYWREGAGGFADLSGHERTVRSLAFVPGVPGSALLSGSEDGTCRLWYLADGSHRILQRRANKLLALAAARTPDGRTVLATGSANCDVRLWPAIPPPSAPSSPAPEVVRSVALGGEAGETLLALGTAAGTLQVRGTDGALLRQWRLPHGRVASLVCAAGRGAAGFPRGALAFFTPGRDESPTVVERAHSGCVEALALVPSQDLLISGGAEGLVKFWRDGREAAGALRGGAGDVRSLSVLESAAGTLLACATRRQLSVYRLGERQAFHDERLAADAPWFSACVLGAFGDLIVLIRANAAGAVQMSALGEDGGPLQEFAGHSGPVRSLGFGRVGEQDVLVTAGDDRSVCVWDPRSGTLLDRWTARALQLEAAAFRFDEGRLTRALAMEGAVHLALVRRLPSSPSQRS